MNTLFGQLAIQFSAHPENVATEALAFILRGSPTVSQRFLQYVRSVAGDFASSLTYETQQTGLDDSIPDMKCLDSSGTLRVIVENKFWAGLTDNQPVPYIRELQQSGRGCLCSWCQKHESRSFGAS